MTMYYPTSNSFLDSVNINLNQLSTSCSSAVPNGSNSYQQQQQAQAMAAEQASTSAAPVEQEPLEQEEEEAVPSYQSQFPPLAAEANGYQNGTVNGDGAPVANAASAWNNAARVQMPTFQTTQILTIPMEERSGSTDGVREEKMCVHKAMQEFDVKIEFSQQKDRSLSIMIEGRSDQVLKARKHLLSGMQRQGNDTVRIPKEFHGAIVGKGAARLKEIEVQTATKINLPKQGSNDETVTIIGTRESIAHARHRLEVIVADLMKTSTERISVPKVYHAFISGAYNRQVEKWQSEHGCKVNIPPVSVDSDELVLSGDREGVAHVRNQIYKLMDSYSADMGKLEVQIEKAKHKYIIGQRGKGIQDIMANHSVSVEVPSVDDPSQTILLRGLHQHLGGAVSEVYDKAESYRLEKLRCPNWLHRYLIGKDGSRLRELVGENISKVHVAFENDFIVVDGQREYMTSICDRLRAEVALLETTRGYQELKVDSKHHKHIIGKSGSNIKQLCNGKQVQIKIPNESENSNIIRVEGMKNEMAPVVAELKKLIQKVENERSEEIKIENRLHRLLIGQSGNNIRQLRDAYPEVLINFPENNANQKASEKSNIVTVRGPKAQVDPCVKQLQKTAKELAENNYEGTVSILRKYHKNIIGKEGAVINQIRKDTNTRIDMPNQSSPNPDEIKIVGKKQDVDKAKQKMLQIESQQANIVNRELDIPKAQHKAIIGKSGSVIKQIQADCGGDVIVHFPQDGGSKVSIRGDKKDVERVVMRLHEEVAKIGRTEDITVKQDLHRFLIGQKGSMVKKLQEESGGCNLLFDDKSDVITLAGTKENIAKAKQLIEARVKQLENTSEAQVDVEPKYHRHFMQNNRRVLNQVSDEFGGVQISFPPVNSPSPTVRVKGPTEYVELAKEKIAQIAKDLAEQTWIYVEVDAQHHRTILGKSGSNVQQIEADLTVRIKFPDQGRPQGASESSPVHSAQINAMMAMSGGQDKTAPVEPQGPNQVLVMGRKENVEKAKQRILSLVPVESYVEVQQRFHSSLIGSGGGHLREMQTKHNVRITLPRPGGANMNSGASDNVDPDRVIVFGIPENVEKAKSELEVIVKELVAKSYRVEFHVDPKYFPRIIGPKGSNINKLKEQHGVEIILPRGENAGNRGGAMRNGGDSEEQQNGEATPNPVVVIGYQEQADKCAEAIKQMVSDIESQVSVTIEIENDFHGRFIGPRGKNLRQMEEKYKVEIKFPGKNSSAEENNKVTISGPEKGVDDCRDKMLCLKEEYKLEQDGGEESLEQKYMHPSSQFHANNRNKQENNAGDNNSQYNNNSSHQGGRQNRRRGGGGGGNESSGYVVRDAPWDPSSQDFPALDMAPRPNGASAPSWPVKRS